MPPRFERGAKVGAVTGGAAAWIAPLAAGQPELGELDLGRLHRFDMTLREPLARFPIGAGASFRR